MTTFHLFDLVLMTCVVVVQVLMTCVVVQAEILTGDEAFYPKSKVERRALDSKKSVKSNRHHGECCCQGSF